MRRRWIFWTFVTLATVLVAGVGLAEQAEDRDDGSAPGVEPPSVPSAETAEEQARRAEVVAVVNGSKISVAEYEDRLNKQGPFRRVQYSAPEKRREFLDEMVDWELQGQEARRRGYHQDESVGQQVKRVMSSLLLRREVDDRVRPEDVTEEELRAYYQENIGTFQRPERVRAYQIVVSDRTKAQGLLQRVLGEEGDTREFRRLARELSEDAETKRRGGDLRYFTRPNERQEGDPEVHEAVVKATFELLEKRRAAQKRAASKAGGDQAGPGSDPPGFNPVYPKLLETPEGFRIIRFMGHREEVNRTFDEVEKQIRNRIWREKLQTAREDFIGNLREKHRVVVHDDALELVRVDAASQPGGTMPIKSGTRPDGVPGPPMKRLVPRGPEGPEAPEEEAEHQAD